MSIINSCSLLVRLKRELPPSGPLPATLQTLAGWYLPYAYPEYCHARLGDRFTVYPLHMPPLVFLSDPQDIRAVLTGSSTDLHPGAGAQRHTFRALLRVVHGRTGLAERPDRP